MSDLTKNPIGANLVGPPKFTPFSWSAADGDVFTLSQPDANARYLVVGYRMSKDAASSITWKSAATTIEGPMPVPADSPGSPECQHGMFVTEPGDDLVLNSNAGANHAGGGGLSYYVIQEDS